MRPIKRRPFFPLLQRGRKAHGFTRELMFVGITGTFDFADIDPDTGTVQFRPTKWLRDPYTKMVVTDAPVAVQTDTTGHFFIRLAVMPADGGEHYIVTEPDGTTYCVVVPASPYTVDLSELALC